MKNPKTNTLRLLMPQWQGGNNAVPYPIGARLLAWLAPKSDAPVIEVPVKELDGAVSEENGVVEQNALLKQAKAARNIINAYEPDRIIVFGGDCLVSQAPFAYLNERYSGKLGVLWIDAHPDVSTPKNFRHEHAMVLGNLLGEGDPLFAKEVKIPIKPQNVMLAGADDTLDYETQVIKRLGLKTAKTDDIKKDSNLISGWIDDNSLEEVAIHLDLDVLDPKIFRSQLFANPIDTTPINAYSGKLNFTHVTRLIKDVAAKTNVVGLSIAEHMPWDAINLKNMMEEFHFMK